MNRETLELARIEGVEYTFFQQNPVKDKQYEEILENLLAFKQTKLDSDYGNKAIEKLSKNVEDLQKATFWINLVLLILLGLVYILFGVHVANAPLPTLH